MTQRLKSEAKLQKKKRKKKNLVKLIKQISQLDKCLEADITRMSEEKGKEIHKFKDNLLWAV